MQEIIAKAKKIRLAIFDVDGVLTNGMLYYAPDGTELKKFHVHDGQGLKLLQKTGVSIAIITSRQSTVVTKRMQDLGITHVYQNQKDKVPAYEEIKQKLKVTDDEIAYVGDDLPDLPLIRRVGLGITVANAPDIMQKHAHWVTQAEGGQGAAREVCDFIMQAQGHYQQIINTYLER